MMILRPILDPKIGTIRRFKSERLIGNTDYDYDCDYDYDYCYYYYCYPAIARDASGTIVGKRIHENHLKRLPTGPF